MAGELKLFECDFEVARLGRVHQYANRLLALDRTLFRNRIDGCRQDLCGGVTKSGARDRDGEGGRGWDAAGTSVVTAVANMPELAFGNAQVRRQEASGESRGTVLTLACAPRQAAHWARRRSGRPKILTLRGGARQQAFGFN